MKYFFDTSMLVEVAAGNPQLELFLRNEHTFLKENLAELYYVILQKFGTKAAQFYFQLFFRSAADIPNTIIPEAMEFRNAHKKKNFSYIDCLGYTYARKTGFVFLTKDAGFDGIDGVQLIKGPQV